MNISLLSVTANSGPTLDKLEQLKDTFPAEGKRIGLTKRGELVIFKGSRFLLHPRQCQRARDLMQEYDFVRKTTASPLTSLKFKELRMNKAPVADLLALLTKIKARSDTGNSPFRSIFRACEQVPVKIPHRPSVTLSDVMGMEKAVKRGDSRQEPDTCGSAVSDDGYESGASANARRLRTSTEDMESKGAPPLPPKKNREALRTNVENARRALQDPTVHSRVVLAPVPKPRPDLVGTTPERPGPSFAFGAPAANRQHDDNASHALHESPPPEPKPRYHLTGTTPVSPEPSFAFGAPAANRQDDGNAPHALYDSDGSDSSDESTLVGSRASLASMRAKMPFSRTTSLTSISSGSSESSASSGSSTSSLVDELRQSPWAKDSLIENMLRTQGL